MFENTTRHERRRRLTSCGMSWRYFYEFLANASNGTTKISTHFFDLLDFASRLSYDASSQTLMQKNAQFKLIAISLCQDGNFNTKLTYELFSDHQTHLIEMLQDVSDYRAASLNI